jgi:anti-sigma-K factor RskA
MSERNDTSMQELAAAYALGALSPEETRAFEAYLATSPETQREVAEYREVSAMLATAARSPAPSSDLKARVLDRVAAAKLAALPPTREPRSSVPASLWLALAASLALATWLGASLYTARAELAAREAAGDSVRAALAAVQDRLTQREKTLNWILEPGIELSVLNSTGNAEPKIQFFMNRQKRVAMVHAFNLGQAEAGKVYQLWFIQDGKPVPSVTFNSEADGHAMVENIEVPMGSGITHAAVTVEPTGGSPAPTSPVVLLGEVKSS